MGQSIREGTSGLRSIDYRNDKEVVRYEYG